MHPPRSHKLPAAALAALMSCAVAACGSTSSADSGSGQASDETKAVKFAQCLREHGIEADAAKGAPSGAPALTLRAGGPGSGGSGAPANLEAAQKACSRYRPSEQGPKQSPAERAARVDQLYKFARCMREHGVEVKTEVQNGGGAVGIQLKGVNPRSPGFQSAQKACEAFMPFKGPRRSGVGPPAGVPGPGSGSVQSLGG